MRVLVDTSIWSLALRRAQTHEAATTAELRRLIADHRVEIIGPVRQEILSGIRDQAQFERLEKYLAPFQDIVLETPDYITAAMYFNQCRAKGIQGSNTDYLICAVAVRHDCVIFTADQDFSLFATCLPITLHELTEQGESRAMPTQRARRTRRRDG